jgi:uncharacterized protein (TIGR00725 family)
MLPKKSNLIISVIGAGQPSTKALRLAYEVGQELGRREITLICGGLGGVMEAVCRGAHELGSTTIGILPGNDPNDANPYVSIPIATGLGHTRNSIVAKAGRAVIAIDGSYGTLSEIAHALIEGIPVVGLGTWAISMNGDPDSSIIEVENPIEAVEKAVKAALDLKR